MKVLRCVKCNSTLTERPGYWNLLLCRCCKSLFSEPDDELENPDESMNNETDQVPMVQLDKHN